ncbi:hypothetical protein LCGC14_1509900 [marine sediment metagenome]|uniref:Uncharacterized protein n=1 Tax=marine sediment metagenome TaxID=412755 RepID=A0A0F9J1Y9_9ZZZZ
MYPEFEGGGSTASLFQYAKDIIPFYDSLLFGVILTILVFSIYFIQETKRGRGDFPVAFAVGNTATTVLAIIISMISDFMSGTTLGIFISITIVSYIWLFFSNP